MLQKIDVDYNNTILDVVHLKVYFPVRKWGPFKRGYVKAVDDVSLSVEKNKIYGLIGESGSGKTTLGRAIVMLERPTDGKILFMRKNLWELKGHDLKYFRRSVQMIFQDPFAALNPLWTVFKNLSLPLFIHDITDKKEIQRLCIQALTEVKLAPHYLEKFPHELSGGERQRICIARALILKPRLIVADEPTSMIDASLKGDICKLLVELKEKYNTSYLFISHEINVAQKLSEQMLIMYLGKIVEVLTTHQAGEYLHPYSKLLMYGMDYSIPDEVILRFKGEIPSALTPPSGCRFHTRCIYATPICTTQEPPLVEVEPGHFVACFLYD
jgi:peptide/nickel transport system ATP-binding protein